VALATLALRTALALVALVAPTQLALTTLASPVTLAGLPALSKVPLPPASLEDECEFDAGVNERDLAAAAEELLAPAAATTGLVGTETAGCGR